LCYAKYKKELLILLLCLKNGGPLYKWNFLVVSSFSHSCYSRTPPPIAFFFPFFSVFGAEVLPLWLVMIKKGSVYSQTMDFLFGGGGGGRRKVAQSRHI
jgi:hypothetical protein